MSQKTKVAAIQMEAPLGEVQRNIAQAGDLAEQALKHGAKIVALPEFFTTQILYDKKLYQCSLPPENPALDMLKMLSEKYEATLGGSYLEKRGDDVYNTYVLVEPDGTVHRHDKDQPTMVENAFYIGGSDPGHTATQIGYVGMAVCWETIRTRTLTRLSGKVDLLMTGSHWWTAPHNWKLLRFVYNFWNPYNVALMKRTPGLFASMVGAPNIHASHCGILEGPYQFTTDLIKAHAKMELLGEAQITDAQGKILARREPHEGPGIIMAEIELGAAKPVQAPDRFWIDDLPFIFKLFWWQQNFVASRSYRNAKRKGQINVYKFQKEKEQLVS